MRNRSSVFQAHGIHHLNAMLANPLASSNAWIVLLSLPDACLVPYDLNDEELRINRLATAYCFSHIAQISDQALSFCASTPPHSLPLRVSACAWCWVTDPASRWRANVPDVQQTCVSCSLLEALLEALSSLAHLIIVQHFICARGLSRDVVHRACLVKR